MKHVGYIPYSDEGKYITFKQKDNSTQIRVQKFTSSLLAIIKGLLFGRASLHVQDAAGKTRDVTVSYWDFSNATGISSSELKQASAAQKLEEILFTHLAPKVKPLKKELENYFKTKRELDEYYKYKTQDKGITQDELITLVKIFEQNKQKWERLAQASTKGKTSEIHLVGQKKYKFKTVIGEDKNSFQTYLKVDRIGVGCFGKVYLAINLNEMRLMAQKSSNLHETNIEKAKREVQISRELEKAEGAPLPGLIHYHNVSYYASKQKNTKQRLFMDLCDVGALTNLYKGKVKVSKKEFCHIAMTALEGLDALHSCNPPIVHGDIKKDNLCVRTIHYPKNSNKPSKKIGVVIDAQRAFKPSLGEESFSSPLYLSPEILLSQLKSWIHHPQAGLQLYGPAQDVWAMGCALYEAANRKDVPWCDQFASIMNIIPLLDFKIFPNWSYVTNLEEAIKKDSLDYKLKKPLLDFLAKARENKKIDFIDLIEKFNAYFKEIVLHIQKILETQVILIIMSLLICLN